jgi:hypothetical protein
MHPQKGGQFLDSCALIGASHTDNLDCPGMPRVHPTAQSFADAAARLAAALAAGNRRGAAKAGTGSASMLCGLLSAGLPGGSGRGASKWKRGFQGYWDSSGTGCAAAARRALVSRAPLPLRVTRAGAVHLSRTSSLLSLSPWGASMCAQAARAVRARLVRPRARALAW